MDKRDRELLRIILALMPILAGMTGVWEAFFLGGMAMLMAWLSTSFFQRMRPFFPERWRKAAFIFWVATLGQLGFFLCGVAPYWCLSGVLLMPEELWAAGRPKGDWALRMPFRSGMFLCLALSLGMAREFLGNWLLIHTFQMPVGAFLLLGAAAGLWRAAPWYQKGRSRG